MSNRRASYLDANAGAPLSPVVVQALRSLLEDHPVLANASSIHSHGRQAKRLVADARENIARSLGCADSEQITFTSSGSEANQLPIRMALSGALERAREMSVQAHWITTPIEHDCVLQMRAWFEAQGGAVSFLPVDEQGRVQVSALESLKQPGTALVSLIWVNNETGVIADARRAGHWCKKNDVILHVDGCQAWGKLPIDLDHSDFHFAAFAPHKIGALSGIGVLWQAPVSRFPHGKFSWSPLSPAVLGKQEKGRRGGTENIMGIVAAGAAAKGLDPQAFTAKVTPLRDDLERMLRERIVGVVINGAGADRVPNTVNLAIAGIESDGLVMAMDLAGFAVSAGSACASGVMEPSHVLKAMGLPRPLALAALRVSLSSSTTLEEIHGFVDALDKVATRLRAAKTQAAQPERSGLAQTPASKV